MTSLIAVLRGEREPAVGNVIGSNLTNILLIAGSTAIVTGQGVSVAPAIANFDMPVMIAAALACLPIFLSGYRIERWEGLFFLACYVAYVAYLYLESMRHESLEAYSWMMVVFVLPLILVTLIVISVQEYLLRRRRRRGASPE